MVHMFNIKNVYKKCAPLPLVPHFPSDCQTSKNWKPGSFLHLWQYIKWLQTMLNGLEVRLPPYKTKNENEIRL